MAEWFAAGTLFGSVIVLAIAVWFIRGMRAAHKRNVDLLRRELAAQRVINQLTRIGS